jgi:hypothetical protein
MSATPTNRKFSLGVVNVSPAAMEALFRNGENLTGLLQRHVSGDFGVMCYDDKQVNEKSIREGGRVLSSYPLQDDTVLWVLTEPGWQSTLVIIREEY